MAGFSDDLVAAAQDGDRDALRTVYEVLAPKVLGYLRAKGVRDPEAVTNDVFLALLTHMDRVKGGAEGLRKLAFTIAHARMVDDYRSRSRQPGAVSYDPADDTRTVPSAEDDADHVLAAARVRAVLAVLPEDQREVLTLRVVADLSIEQIAAVMGRSQGAVKQLQRRGMIAVRQALADRHVTL
ncbi:MAG: RNA polymerase sigma factor [Jatrophihabitantaceae bacterium]